MGGGAGVCEPREARRAVPPPTAATGATTPGSRPATLGTRYPAGDRRLFGEPVARPRHTLALALSPAGRRAAALSLHPSPPSLPSASGRLPSCHP